ncbi:hypothetical protein HNQ93_004075 [Hymenobacter luteus]|uniref:DUF3408 domain-containing protein n=3 Tax=Hymenobacter TaxID=89966 RepID=A0A3R9LY27_9BACT|nr:MULTISPECIES: hypothetical protein [Hymenobacter]MBB4603450.1 hypothetical protein [Hymenobacter latericoloratus]MBB6061196.1 hypothetical protein [Hymenobacter luteus]RSK24952.1 hypothetical protein EI290_18165 [Hymenobacter metallilatus]
MAKKTTESKEAAAERRQRELAALTSGVAAFSLMGDAPRPVAPAPAPAEASAAAVAETPAAPSMPPAAEVAPPAAAKEPAGKKATPAPEVAAVPAAPVQAVEPAAAAPAPVGEEPRAAAPAPLPSPAPASAPEEEDGEEAEELPVATPVTAGGELDLAQLFVPSAEKKTTTLRITADHQQYFTQLGFILGGGASAPDIIHNILNRFRQEHEAQLQKAMKKQIRQMMAPKK